MFFCSSTGRSAVGSASLWRGLNTELLQAHHGRARGVSAASRSETFDNFCKHRQNFAESWQNFDQFFLGFSQNAATFTELSRSFQGYGDSWYFDMSRYVDISIFQITYTSRNSLFATQGKVSLSDADWDSQRPVTVRRQNRADFVVVFWSIELLTRLLVTFAPFFTSELRSRFGYVVTKDTNE